MVITYRRTGGLLMLLTLAAAGLAAATLTVVVAGILLIVASAIAAVAFVWRAVLPERWRTRTVPPATPWPQETIDVKVIKAAPFDSTRNSARMDGDAR